MTKTAITYSLGKLAELTGSAVLGDATTLIAGVCSLDNPKPGYIALALDLRSYADDMKKGPSAFIVPIKVKNYQKPLLVNANPRQVFAQILRKFNPDPVLRIGSHPDTAIHPDANVHPSASIGPYAVIAANAKIASGVQVGAGCYIGQNAVIGKNTRIFPNVSVLHDVTIGERCLINSGVVIGSEGFGFTPGDTGNLKIPQVGTVIIGNDVEIGANSTIDRATIDATVIEDDVKIDNLVQIAHNVRIGAHTRIAAQAGVSGRVIIEPNVVIAGQAGLQNGIKIGEGSMIGGQAGVTRHVPPGSQVSGYPARDHKKALQLLAATNKLPDLITRVEELEKKLKKNPDKSK